jgi:hypothetical protein
MTFLFAAGGAALGAAGVGGLTLATGGMLGLGIGSALNSSKAAGQAAQTQADAANRSADLQKQMFDQQMKLQEPYRVAGLTGQNRMLDLLGLSKNKGAAGYGKYAQDFGMADYQADPGYAFRLSEGMKQLGHQAAGRGGAISGQTMKGIQDYAQNAASQEYQNAYNRYQQNRTNQLQPLGNLMASGQSAASNQGSAAGNYGANAGNAYMAAGQAIGAGQLGQANTLANTLGSTASAYQNQINFNNWLAQSQRPTVSQPAYATPSYVNPSNPYAQFYQGTGT